MRSPIPSRVPEQNTLDWLTKKQQSVISQLCWFVFVNDTDGMSYIRKVVEQAGEQASKQDFFMVFASVPDSTFLSRIPALAFLFNGL